MKLHLACLGNISAEIGGIFDLRHECYIAFYINVVGSYDIILELGKNQVQSGVKD